MVVRIFNNFRLNRYGWVCNNFTCDITFLQIFLRYIHSIISNFLGFCGTKSFYLIIDSCKPSLTKATWPSFHFHQRECHEGHHVHPCQSSASSVTPELLGLIFWSKEWWTGGISQNNGLTCPDWSLHGRAGESDLLVIRRFMPIRQRSSQGQHAQKYSVLFSWTKGSLRWKQQGPHKSVTPSILRAIYWSPWGDDQVEKLMVSPFRR